jgi:hypothetical protein
MCGPSLPTTLRINHRSAIIQASRYVGRANVHPSTLSLLVHGVSMPPLNGGRDLEMEENLEGVEYLLG